MIEPSTSPTLLNLATHGDAAAWRRIVQIYGPLVYQWSRRLGLQPADAADAMQDTMVSVSRDLAKFDGTTASGKFRGWLWTILRRRIADAHRRRPDELPMGSAVDGLAVDGLAMNGLESDIPPGDEPSQTASILQRAVAAHRERYDPKTWQLFWATVVEGRAAEEVAETNGVTKWAVYKARARILQRLREELEGLM